MMQKISHAAAMSPGQDLWILADLHSSKWTQKLNWYLNFHIRDSLPKPTPHPDLEQIVQQCELKVQKIPLSDTSPLLVASKNLLPNIWTAVIPFKDPQQWFQQLTNTVKSIQLNEARIFLPEKIKSNDSIPFFEEPPFNISIVDSL